MLCLLVSKVIACAFLLLMVVSSQLWMKDEKSYDEALVHLINRQQSHHVIGPGGYYRF